MYDELTEQDIKKMEEEIEYRKLVVRKEALEAVKEARAQGDLSENFEYHAAKKDKNQNESRIRYLERIKRQALHSYRLTFSHPITGESFVLTAPLPDDMHCLFPDFS